MAVDALSGIIVPTILVVSAPSPARHLLVERHPACVWYLYAYGCYVWLQDLRTWVG